MAKYLYDAPGVYTGQIHAPRTRLCGQTVSAGTAIFIRSDTHLGSRGKDEKFISQTRRRAGIIIPTILYETQDYIVLGIPEPGVIFLGDSENVYPIYAFSGVSQILPIPNFDGSALTNYPVYIYSGQDGLMPSPFYEGSSLDQYPEYLYADIDISLPRPVYDASAESQYPEYAFSGESTVLPAPQFGSDGSSQYPGYAFSGESTVLPALQFGSDGSSQYPGYAFSGESTVLPAISVDSPSESFYPEYAPEAITAISITNPGDQSLMQYSPYELFIPATGVWPISVTATNMPPGLSAQALPNGVLISGIATSSTGGLVGINISDRLGRTAGISFLLTVNPQQKIPVITDSIPDSFGYNGEGAVLGYNFGSSGDLLIDGNPATIISWAENMIVFSVPNVTGLLAIQVTHSAPSNIIFREFRN